MADAAPKPAAVTDNDRCVTALRQLAEGKLGRWRSLTAHCSRAHAEKALGPATGEDRVDGFAGLDTPYRTYPATAAAPEGIVVWFSDQRIVLVCVGHPTLAEPLETSLRSPEAQEPSLLGSGQMQWIYASRGIVVHAWGTNTTTPFRLYAFQPTSVAAFRKSPLSRVYIHRIPLDP
jgi:hypothetical protein